MGDPETMKEDQDDFSELLGEIGPADASTNDTGNTGKDESSVKEENGLVKDAASNNDNEEKKENQNRIKIYRVAKEIHDSENIFVDQYHTPYAFVKIKDHSETLDLDTKRFERWVYRRMIQYHNGRPILPESKEVTAVLDYLKSMAEFDAVTKMMHLRVAGDNDSIYYDLSNPRWETIKIISAGWIIEETPTMMFRRYNNQIPQVYPSRDYNKDIFDRLVNLINVKDESSKLLLKCYIIALFIPDIPKAILMLHGEPNSAKTTLLKLIKMLIDPCSTHTLTCKSGNDELAQLFSHNYLPYFDNLSYIPDWMSDAFCRAVTGDSFTKRKLYTDNDDIFYTFMRCLGFSGVNLAATKSDLLDRGLIIELQRISTDKQRQIKHIWKEFQEMKPQLLGYIFDILANVLKKRQTSHVDVKGLPRLADWAEVCELISRCMGYKENQFIEAFGRNVKLQNEAAVEDSAIAQAIIYLMENQSRWEGTPTALLAQLETFTPLLSINTKNHKIWPSKPNILSRRLKYVISNLKEFGINIRPGDNSATKNRTLRIEKGLIEKCGQTSILPIHRYDTQDRAQNASDTAETPIQENTQNRAQNGPGIDSIDTIDISPKTALDDIPQEIWTGIGMGKSSGSSQKTNQTPNINNKSPKKAKFISPVTGNGTSSETDDNSPDFNFGDFQCYHCNRCFTSDTNRLMHRETDHPDKLDYPEPEDFANRLSPNRRSKK
jgi:hypothetical protein